MRFKAELHTHSVLSGCADKDNSVPNLLNMAKILEIDIFALSDHNAVENVTAAIEMGQENDILIIPAMEVTTSEDAHILCLFKDYASAKAVCDDIRDSMPKYALNTAFYNEQRITDKNDETISKVDYLLSVACGFDVYELFEKVKNSGGVAIPAHVDKESNGLLAILGDIPDDLGVTTVEVSPTCPEELLSDLKKKFRIIKSSDAHNLESLCENDFFIDLKEKTALCLVNELNKKRE